MFTEFVKSYFEEHTSCPGTVSLYGSQSRGFHPLPPRARRRATCTWGARGVDSAGAPPCTRVPFLCMPKEKVLRTRGLFGPSQTCATGTRDPKERAPRAACARRFDGRPSRGTAESPCPVSGGSAAKFETGLAQPLRGQGSRRREPVPNVAAYSPRRHPIAGTTGRTAAVKTSCSYRLMGNRKSTPKNSQSRPTPKPEIPYLLGKKP
jgi:hypothetical protein